MRKLSRREALRGTGVALCSPALALKAAGKDRRLKGFLWTSPRRAIA
jgi:hypothetical protein